MIIFSKSNNIGYLLLNRSEKRNALHPDLINQLNMHLDKIANDDDIKILIISGVGKSFCSGADLAYLNEIKNYSTFENEKDSENLARLFLKIYKFSKPVIAAVNGAAIAGGCGLASVCDFIIAHESDSRFGYSEVKIGFIPAIVSIFLIKKIGEGRAKRLLMTGEIINGKKAFEIGLVDYLAENILEEAEKLANLLLLNSTQSMSATKKLIRNVSNLNIDSAVDYCIKLNTISRNTEDFANGLTNFLNKKKGD